MYSQQGESDETMSSVTIGSNNQTNFSLWLLNYVTRSHVIAWRFMTTAAHHAIANLTAQNFIRVLVTTNFDRLLESNSFESVGA